MSIVSCPRCGDQVSLPPAASASALVQCPLCCEEYYLSDVLIQLPPMLVVVGGHAAAAEKDSDYRLAEQVAATVGQAFDTGISSSATRPQLRTVSRSRRPEKSAVGEIVKVVLGGAAGLAGGLLVLWWFFGVDVGELGPKLSKVDYLRFLVPEKLWDQSVRSGKQPADLEPLDDAKQAKASGKNTKPAGDTGQVAGDSSKEDTGDDTPSKSSKQDDPFLTLNDLGIENTPAPTGAADLTLDDPLSAVTPPKNKPVETPPAESKTGDDDSDAAKEKAPAEKKGEEKPAAEESKDAQNDTPAEEAHPESSR
ncbi:MAG: hypothetical protein WEH44_04995 [Pirellulaceae bacterium]